MNLNGMLKENSLKDKTILVTGGATGLGAARRPPPAAHQVLSARALRRRRRLVHQESRRRSARGRRARSGLLALGILRTTRSCRGCLL